MNEFAYVRVSTVEQNTDRQINEMLDLGIQKENIFEDYCSGSDFERPQYQALLSRVKQGDTIFLHSLDRLGRNYNEILQQWHYIVKELMVNIVILDMPALDTRKDKDLMSSLISDIVLQLLSYVAQTELDMIKQRQKEGIVAAQKRGVKFGRPKKDKPKTYKYVVAEWEKNEINSREAGEMLGVSHTTFLRWVKESY